MWWTLVGGVLEAVGLGVTGWGIYKTWLGSGTRERFVRDAALVRRGSRVVSRAGGWTRRLLGLPGQPVTEATVIGTGRDSGISIGGGGTMVVSGEPSPVLSTEEKLAALDTLVRTLTDKLSAQAKKDRQRIRQVELKARHTATDVRRLRNDLDAAKLDLAVEGLRTEAFGLAMVGLGLLLQLVGGLVT